MTSSHRDDSTSAAQSRTSSRCEGSWIRHLLSVITAFVLVVAALTLGGSRLALSASALPGCRSTSPGSVLLSLNVNGYARKVIVHVPAGSKNLTPMALVLNLHGSFNNAAFQQSFTNMDATSNAKRFIVAYPQAYIAAGTGFQWNVPPLYGGASVPPNSPNDVKFLVTLVKILEGHYCIDPRQVYATGYSGGAREVSQLGCDASRVFAAIAPVDGLRRPTPCNTRRAVSVIAFHGSADPINPFDGAGQAYWTYSVTSAIGYWMLQDHCTHSVKTSAADPTVVHTKYVGCANGAAVELYEVIGAGHVWPGGPPLAPNQIQFLGPQTNAINANQLMWSFFKAHPMH